MPLFISVETWCDLVAVETGENKIQQNDDGICVAEFTISGWLIMRVTEKKEK